jgi:hypothetical protein
MVSREPECHAQQDVELGDDVLAQRAVASECDIWSAHARENGCAR